MLLIKNGRVLDPVTGGDSTQDVLLDGERIEKIAAGISAPDAEVFDAKGLIVAPGFIDLHCHLREPGQEMSETIETGTRSAARGGFTAVCCMPNTQPVNDNAAITRGIVERSLKSRGRSRLAHRRSLGGQQGRSPRGNRGDERCGNRRGQR
jgi:dihydroorotase